MQTTPSARKTATWTNLVLITAMFALLFTPGARAAAVPETQEETQPLFLVLPMPDRDAFRELPTAKNVSQAENLSRDLLRQQAEPLLDELEALKSLGLIERYTFQPENFGVQVYGASPEALMEINRSSSIAYSTISGSSAPACAAKASESLPNQLMIDSKRIEKDARSLNHLSMVETYWLQVYMDPYSGFSQMMGYMPPNQPLRLEIVRNGMVIYTEDSYSESDGWFVFFPYWVNCPQEGYNFIVKPGDTVRVSGASVVESIDIVELQGFANPITNTVTGKTAAQKKVEAVYLIPNQDDCGGHVYFNSATSGADGSFTINTTQDFSAQGFVDLQIFNASGNVQSISAILYHLYSNPAPTKTVGVLLRPNTAYTAYHKRGGDLLEEKSGITGADGGGIISFDQDVTPGDVVEVVGVDVALSMTAAAISQTLDVNTNTITGTTGQNLHVEFHGTNQINYNFSPGSCSGYDSFCSVANTDTTGAFSINANFDLEPGNEYYLYTYDTYGNTISYHYNVPAVGYHAYWNEVVVTWGPGPDPFTVTHKTSAGVVRETFDVYTDPYWRSFWASLANQANPGDVIEVSSTDGQKRSIAVANFPARLRAGTDTFTGTAPVPGKLVTEVRDFNPATGFNTYRCQEQNASGSFTVTFSGQNWGGQDYANYSLRDPNGNFLMGRAHAFGVYTWKETYQVSGRTETPKVDVSVKHTHAGVVYPIKNTTSGSTGYFYINTDQPITEGDTLQVTTADGSLSTFLIPKLILVEDSAKNQVYGQAPSSTFLQVNFYRNYGAYYSENHTVLTRSDSAGNYAINTAGMTWDQHCSPVNVGDGCFYAVVRHYLPNGTGIYLQGDYPTPVAPDSYETDNSWLNATAYNGPQIHTFHDSAEVDWIRFDVTPGMVAGKGYVEVDLNLTNIGWFMEIEGQLYRDVDGSLTLVDGSIGFSESSPKRTLNLTEAGNYYLALAPALNSNSYGGCDTGYRFTMVVVNNRLYTPLISR